MLITFVEALQADALEDFRHKEALYVQGGYKQPPKVPRVLKPVDELDDSPDEGF